VLELLSHVNKRVKGHNEIQLPLEQLLDLYKAPASPVLVRNFALVYVEMAFERASKEQRGKLVSTFHLPSAHHCPCLKLTCAIVWMLSMVWMPPSLHACKVHGRALVHCR
jgi:hypothetical protein